MISAKELSLLQSEFDKSDKSSSSPDRCDNCDLQMTYTGSGEYICSKCSLTKECYGSVTGGDQPDFDTWGSYNTSSASSAPITMVGKSSNQYRRCIMKASSDYKKTQRRNVYNQMHTLNHKRDHFIPKSVIDNTVDLFLQVQEVAKDKDKDIDGLAKVFRGDVRNGVLGACLYYECVRASITKKPKEISSFMGIPDNYLSDGDKKIRVFYNHNLIDIPVEALLTNSVRNFIDTNFELLNLNDHLHEEEPQMKDFVNELVELCKQKRIGKENSRDSTKCTSAIYIMILAKNLNHAIPDQEIASKLNISTSTFKSYTNTVFDVSNRQRVQKKIEKVFQKYGLNIPEKYKDKFYNTETNKLKKEKKTRTSAKVTTKTKVNPTSSITIKKK